MYYNAATEMAELPDLGKHCNYLDCKQLGSFISVFE